jgi:hypothetical protein
MQHKKTIKTGVILVIACAALFCLSGCADANTLTDVAREGTNRPAGFLRGVWHGICAPLAFFGIMFGMDIGIYEVHNTGNWYNFGFLLGIGALGVSSSGASKK